MEDKAAAIKLLTHQQQEKENVECVALEILIQLGQRKNMKEIYFLL